MTVSQCGSGNAWSLAEIFIHSLIDPFSNNLVTIIKFATGHFVHTVSNMIRLKFKD